jgi:hypothetical protein
MAGTSTRALVSGFTSAILTVRSASMYALASQPPLDPTQRRPTPLDGVHRNPCRVGMDSRVKDLLQPLSPGTTTHGGGIRIRTASSTTAARHERHTARKQMRLGHGQEIAGQASPPAVAILRRNAARRRHCQFLLSRGDLSALICPADQVSQLLLDL